MSSLADATPKIVFRLGHMGDVALTTGVLAHWHETHGDRFIFVTREGNAPLLDNHPAIQEVVGLTPDMLDTWFSTAGELARLYKGHTLLDLHGILRSRILSLRWKGPVLRYPKFGLTRRLYDRTRLDVFKRKLEATTVPQRYAMAVADYPPPAAELAPRIYLTDTERAVASVQLASISNNKPLVALHPYATHPSKEWPRAHWLALTNLLETAGMDWFAVGRSETPLAPDDKRDMTSETGLRETCALLERADMLVTNDSGPMHLACGVGTPVTALFGPTAKAWGFYPAGPDDTVLERPMDCRPCSLHGAKPCDKGFECMAGIAPEDVMDTIRKKLDTK